MCVLRNARDAQVGTVKSSLPHSSIQQWHFCPFLCILSEMVYGYTSIRCTFLLIKCCHLKCTNFHFQFSIALFVIQITFLGTFHYYFLEFWNLGEDTCFSFAVKLMFLLQPILFRILTSIQDYLKRRKPICCSVSPPNFPFAFFFQASKFWGWW